ncbi:MAG: hypothetical protein A2W91_00680 [Bacteroidetes bacterium GWF2_38_335]|nr:MAG: hypothetical protein A2W91_00680 [Bacteroidetes bacterium GWF2_38_335]OFY78347.1 MAG: hypothetical protein A2281_04060 [Bacteroidetes bacterium RIFOXYA12_FULL_38_20]HBS87456.1 hypothetical protein [Bacteroidales bacterium]
MLLFFHFSVCPTGSPGSISCAHSIAEKGRKNKYDRIFFIFCSKVKQTNLQKKNDFSAYDFPEHFSHAAKMEVGNRIRTHFVISLKPN